MPDSPAAYAADSYTAAPCRSGGVPPLWNVVNVPAPIEARVLGKRALARISSLRTDPSLAPCLRECYARVESQGRARSTQCTYSSGETYFMEFCAVRVHFTHSLAV